jgi:NADH-quinone oxidoreductase subunit J
MLEQLGFSVIAGAMLASGFKVATSRNLVHTVLWLGVMLAATAGLFVMLLAPFVAAIQLILYTGGLLTLMLFGVMLTQRDAGFTAVPNPVHRRAIAGLCAGSVFALCASAIVKTDLPADAGAPAIGVRALGELFFTVHALAFEILAVLLLAATLGAILFARRTDPAAHGEAGELHALPARKPLPGPAPASDARERSA